MAGLYYKYRIQQSPKTGRRSVDCRIDKCVFVDGNNVVGSRPDGWWRDRFAAARRLIIELEPQARNCGGKWMIVFDGLPVLGKVLIGAQVERRSAR